jgi:2'-5' RNA ligase
VTEDAHEESALIVRVPEVEALVAPFRARHDPAAAKGVPAHVTVLYPFVEPARITPTIVLSLAELFAALPELRVSFAEVRRFPEALYLAPDPAEPIRRMTEQVFARFPETPPYEGRFAEVIPHLTVAHAEEPEQLEAIAAEFGRAARGVLPIAAVVRAVELIVKRDGRWRKRTEFALGTAAAQR